MRRSIHRPSGWIDRHSSRYWYSIAAAFSSEASFRYSIRRRHLNIYRLDKKHQNLGLNYRILEYLMSATPRITLEQWQALVTVVDAGGYARAAELLHKTQ